MIDIFVEVCILMKHKAISIYQNLSFSTDLNYSSFVESVCDPLKTYDFSDSS